MMTTPTKNTFSPNTPAADLGNDFDPNATLHHTLSGFFHDVRDVGGSHSSGAPVTAPQHLTYPSDTPDALQDEIAPPAESLEHKPLDHNVSVDDSAVRHDSNQQSGFQSGGDRYIGNGRDEGADPNHSGNRDADAQGNSVRQAGHTDSRAEQAGLQPANDVVHDQIVVDSDRMVDAGTEQQLDRGTAHQLSATSIASSTTASAVNSVPIVTTPMPTSVSTSVTTVPLDSSVHYSVTEATAATYTAPTADFGTSIWSTSAQSSDTAVASETWLTHARADAITLSDNASSNTSSAAFITAGESTASSTPDASTATINTQATDNHAAVNAPTDTATTDASTTDASTTDASTTNPATTEIATTDAIATVDTAALDTAAQNTNSVAATDTSAATASTATGESTAETTTAESTAETTLDASTATTDTGVTDTYATSTTNFTTDSTALTTVDSDLSADTSLSSGLTADTSASLTEYSTIDTAATDTHHSDL